MRHIVTLFFALFVPAALSAGNDAAFKAGVFSPPRQAPDFSLSGSNGSELKLSHYRGKVVILAFGFTSCVNVCPVTLAVLADARKKLGAQGKDLQVIYVTVDPERDDPKRMREYLAAFDPTIVGGTGTAKRLDVVHRAYGILANKVAEKRAAGNSYSIDHSSYTYLIDRAGNLRALMPYGHAADDYVHDARILLKS